MRPVWLIALPGLSLRLLRDHAAALPAFSRMASDGWLRMLVSVPRVDGDAGEATLLTGVLPSFHGVMRDGDSCRARPFWERAGGGPVTVRCGLFGKSLGFATPGCEPEYFPGHSRNGARILELLTGDGPDMPGSGRATVGAFRMHGLSAISLDEGPTSPRLAKRLISFDAFVGALLDAATRHGASVCISGMYAVAEVADPILSAALPRPRFSASSGPDRGRHPDPADQPAILFFNCAPVGDSGVPKDTLGSAEIAWILLHQLTGRRWQDHAPQANPAPLAG